MRALDAQAVATALLAALAYANQRIVPGPASEPSADVLLGAGALLAANRLHRLSGRVSLGVGLRAAFALLVLAWLRGAVALAPAAPAWMAAQLVLVVAVVGRGGA